MFTQEAVLKLIEKPEFDVVIELLVEWGLLIGRWTAEDIPLALARLQDRFEIVMEFESAQDIWGVSGSSLGDKPAGPARPRDRLERSTEEQLFRAAERRAAYMSVWNVEQRKYKTEWQRQWRAKPENHERELARERDQAARKREQARWKRESSARLKRSQVAAERRARYCAFVRERMQKRAASLKDAPGEGCDEV
jgi:hypothetical protein